MSAIDRLVGGCISSVLGEVTIRPVKADSTVGSKSELPMDKRTDVPMLHHWITHPRSTFWGVPEATEAEIRAEYERIALSRHEAAWILSLDGKPLALAETYDPAHVVLASCDAYEHQAGDIGMHILVSPPGDSPVHGLTDSLLSALMRWLFDSGTQRVVVEPDARNTAIHLKNARVGFSQPGIRAHVPFGNGVKEALLQSCTPERFAASAAAPLTCSQPEPHSNSGAALLHAGWRAAASVDGLDSAQVIEATHRILLAKAIREFTHERLLVAVDTATEVPFEADTLDELANSTEPRTYRVDFGDLPITFEARPHALLHLSVDPHSLRVEGDVHWSPDVVKAIAGAAEQFGIPSNFLPTYLEEVSATFAVRLRTASLPRPSAAELCDPRRSPVEEFQAVEAAMVEGHPGFLANSGRGGMGEGQLRRWAPEMNTSFHLVWCAAAKEHTLSTGNEQADAASTMSQVAPWFRDAAREQGLDPDGFVPFPVHPWQWEQRMTTTFAADIAAGRLVPLTRGNDLYRPQQSLRTFFNLSRPELPYVKTAVAVQNMGFTRGLSAAYMGTTPPANDWLLQQLGNDPEFIDNGVGFLPEIVTSAYTGDAYHAVESYLGNSDTPHLKMTAALWRQSPFDPSARPSPEEGVRLSTMAAVLHRDPGGRTIVAEWIERSNANATTWLDALLRVYLRPLVHALIAHGIAFMPHTENVILRLRDGMPVGVYHKDLGEEMAVVSRAVDLPHELERLRVDLGAEDPSGWAQQALAIHTDVIDGVLRHLAALMDDEGLIPETTFWARARACLDSYANDHPGVTSTGIWAALTAPRSKHSTLNRLQMRNPNAMVDLNDQNASFIYAGTLPNPLHSPE